MATQIARIRAPLRFPLPVLTNFIAAWKQIRKEKKR